MVLERSGSRIPLVFADLGGKEEREGCLFDREKRRGGRGVGMMPEREKRICGGEGEGERKEEERREVDDADGGFTESWMDGWIWSGRGEEENGQEKSENTP